MNNLKVYPTKSLALEASALDCLEYIISQNFSYKLRDMLEALNQNIHKINFDTQILLREFLFPHIHDEDMPLKLKEKCKAKIEQIELEKQVVETVLVNILSLDVIKYCVVVFI